MPLFDAIIKFNPNIFEASLFRPVLDKGNVAIKLIANKQALESLMV